MELKLNKNSKNALNIGFLEALARVRKVEKAMIKESKLKVTPKELNYMALLMHQNWKQSDVKKILDISKGTLSTMVKVLIRKGFLTQTANPKDKRVKDLLATKKGQQVLDLNDKIRAAIKKDLLSKITQEELDIFTEIALKIR